MGDNNQVEGNVAIAALVISLMALIVTLNQLLLQLFNSADGYRRCAESVIGAWHVRRHRVWKWSEFRFETQYVTPQIILLNQAEFEEYKEEQGGIYAINGPQLKEKDCKELNDTVHQAYAGFRNEKRVSTMDGFTRAPKNGSTDIEKSATSTKKRKTPAQLSVRTKNDPLVSWLRLLTELHNLSRSYWPNECPVCDSDRTDKAELDTGANTSTLRKKTHVDDLIGGLNGTRTNIAVIYRTWTWDFMPPDIIRPLAEISVGDIVLLAMRMGMQWRVITPELGKMQADGNGYSLTSTEVRGLGVVLRFAAAGPVQPYPRLIPSRAVDKMLCSIIPGDPVLVRRDFPSTNLSDPDGILTKFGFPEARRRDLRHHAYFEIRNDTLTLLLPFLPLEASTMTRYCFPGWAKGPAILSVYVYWEGRIALHRQLQLRIKAYCADPESTSLLQEVLDRFGFLEQSYGNDWYARWHAKSEIRNDHSGQDKLDVLVKLRRLFDWTTKYFVDHSFDTIVTDGVTLYMHLIAAHANLVDHAVEQAKAFVEKYPFDRSQDALRRQYNILPGYGPHFVLEEYEVGVHYAKNLHHPERGIRTYLEQKGINMSLEDVEVAWWVMQLRGIVFHISTWHPPGIVDQVIGEPLPYHLYGNKTPVWIT